MKEFEEAKIHIDYLEKNIQEIDNFKKLHLQYAKKIFTPFPIKSI